MIWIFGFTLIEMMMFCSQWQVCCRTPSCCEENRCSCAHRDLLVLWKSKAEETGRSPDPLSLKYYTLEDDENKQACPESTQKACAHRMRPTHSIASMDGACAAFADRVSLYEA